MNAVCGCLDTGPLELRSRTCARADHNARVVDVVCEKCGKEQKNARGRCRCGSLFAVVRPT